MRPSRARSADRLSSSRFIRRASGQSFVNAASIGTIECFTGWTSAMRIGNRPVVSDGAASFVSSSQAVAALRACLANDVEQALPAQRPRPEPYLPGMRIVTYREEDDLGLADQVLERHVTHPASRRRNSAVERIVAIVAHHEEVIRRDGI